MMQMILMQVYPPPNLSLLLTPSPTTLFGISEDHIKLKGFSLPTALLPTPLYNIVELKTASILVPFLGLCFI